MLQLQTGDVAAAQTSFEEEARLAREIGDTWGLAMALNSLGDVARAAGDHPRAAPWYEASLRLLRDLDIAWGIPDLLHNLGYVALHQDDTAQAERLFKESLARFVELEDRRGVAECLLGLAGVASAYGAPARAARLLGAARGTLEALGTSTWPSNTAELEHIEAATLDALGPLAYSAAVAAGRGMTLAEAIEASQAGAPAASTNPDGGPGEDSDQAEPLSRREREVAALIGRGLANREIAGALVIAERTVETHVTHVLTKLGLRSRAQIAVWAAKHGLLDGDAD